jgi:hypothetical protein
MTRIRDKIKASSVVIGGADLTATTTFSRHFSKHVSVPNLKENSRFASDIKSSHFEIGPGGLARPSEMKEKY